MTNITSRTARSPSTHRDETHAGVTLRRASRTVQPYGRTVRFTERCARGSAPHLSGRTTPRIGIDPAPASVTCRPGRGACTIAPSPTYMPTWLASP